MKRTMAAVAAAVSLLALTLAGSTQVSAQDESPAQPLLLEVHRVDARQSPVEMSVLTSDYSLSPSDMNLVADGEAVTDFTVTRASQVNRPMEIVFVADTNSSLSQGAVLDEVGEQMAQAISAQPARNQIALLTAGETAILQSGFDSPRSEVVRAARNMRASNGTSLYNALSRAGSLFSESDDTIKTVVVFSAGADDSSEVTSVDVSGEFVRKGVQVIVVRFNGGDLGIARIADVTGGGIFDAPTRSDVAAAIAVASEIGSDRLFVSYDGPTSANERGDVTLAAQGASATVSYAAGELTIRSVGLAPAPPAIDTGGIDFLKSRLGFFLILALTIAGVSLAVWSLGNLFAGGETSLEGMLRRYSGEGFEEMTEEDTVTVQTALVQRAVELSESFAEDRGFLLRVEELLERASLPLRAGEAMGIFLGITIVGFALGFLFGGVINGIIICVLAAMFTVFGVQFKASRRIKKFEAQLPDTLQLLAGTLRAGYSLPQGLEAVSHEISEPMGYELRRAMTEARLGREIEEALEGVATRLNSPDFAWAVMAIGIQREVGGNLNELLMTVSDTMIARERLKGEVAALTAEGKLSAFVLGGLPPGLGVVMWVMNPKYINQLFVTTIGNILLGAGIVMAGIGLAWMKKVITVNV